MANTALGAEKEKAIIFISDAHEKFYYEKLKEVRYQDVYHKALVYCLGISDDTRRNIYSIYDFKTGCVKTECLHEGWQTSGSLKVVRMAFNLYCNISENSVTSIFGFLCKIFPNHLISFFVPISLTFNISPVLQAWRTACNRRNTG